MTSCVSSSPDWIDQPATLPLDLLTKRQREVLTLLGEGHGRAEIAQRLFRSPKTVDNHCTRIYEKLGVHSQASLIRLLHEHGMLSEPQTPERGAGMSGGALSCADALSRIESRVQAAPNSEYFNAFLLGLCDVTDMDLAGICEVDHEASRFIAIASVADGKPIGQISSDFESCECDETFRLGQHLIQSDLDKLFPRATTLSRAGAVAYAGVLLEDRFVGKVGTLWVASRSPIENPDEVMSTLCAVRRRAATELGLQLAIDRLDELGISIGS